MHPSSGSGPDSPALSSETWALKRAATVNPSVSRRERPLWRAVISHPRKNNTDGRPAAERQQSEEWRVKAGRGGKSPSVPAGVRSLAPLVRFYSESCRRAVAACPSMCSNTFIYQLQAAWRPSETLLDELGWTERLQVDLLLCSDGSTVLQWQKHFLKKQNKNNNNDKMSTQKTADLCKYILEKIGKSEINNSRSVT